ncbi:hypothetical protein ACHAWF_012447 [Thalassiosira exigua]
MPNDCAGGSPAPRRSARASSRARRPASASAAAATGSGSGASPSSDAASNSKINGRSAAAAATAPPDGGGGPSPSSRSGGRGRRPPARFEAVPALSPGAGRKKARSKSAGRAKAKKPGPKAKAKKAEAAPSSKPASKPSAASSSSSAKAVAHTTDGTPVVVATAAELRLSRRGLGPRADRRLVRVTNAKARSELYCEAAAAIGDREASALPYHGGRTWKVEVKVGDAGGARGDNAGALARGRAGAANDKDGGDANVRDKPDQGAGKGKGKGQRKRGPTPLFRWYRGRLVLAVLPHLLDDVVDVASKLGTGKKRWANGLSDDEFDSSDEEWDDPKFAPESEPKTGGATEAVALTASAYEDAIHPPPAISRTWISPDLKRFPSRRSALAHAEELQGRDLLVDRVLYGYGRNGARLRPQKPTRRRALEAGKARFERDGLWVVGQEEMWIAGRREALVRKVERRRAREEGGGGEATEGGGEGPGAAEAAAAAAQVPAEATAGDDREPPQDEEEERGGGSKAMDDPGALVDQGPLVGSELPAATAAGDSGSNADDAKADDAKIVSPAESDASHDGASTAAPPSPAKKRAAVVPPALAPSTHHRLSPAQVDLCYAACVDHYEGVMRTVRARSLHHELADGFDVLRERGRGRYDMEVPAFDEPAVFGFLTDPRRAAWMSVVRTILGDDAGLVHKGCFLSLPGAETQVYHQDGVHLNKKAHKPCYAINVFVPLVDCDMSNGPTEFCLGTHYLGHENFVKEAVYTPCVKAGTPVIFDYRLGHRGLRNSSQGIRPVLYLTYSSAAGGKEFRDSVNFSRKRYRRLGDLAEKPPSRDERAAKRQRVAET